MFAFVMDALKVLLEGMVEWSYSIYPLGEKTKARIRMTYSELKMYELIINSYDRVFDYGIVQYDELLSIINTWDVVAHTAPESPIQYEMKHDYRTYL